MSDRRHRVERNRAYVAEVKEELFCEECFTQNDIQLHGNTISLPQLNVLVSGGYSLEAIEEKFRRSEWLCRRCLLGRTGFMRKEDRHAF